MDPKTGRRKRFVGLGEILWDMLPGGRQLGGAPANFAYHAHALGGQGAVVSCVGGDALGDEILAQLKGWGLECEAVAVDAAHPTGTVTVGLDLDGKPRYTIHEEVAWDFIPYSEAADRLARTADAVCFGSLAQRSAISRKTVRQFLAHLPAEAVRLFDINLRQAYYTAEVITVSLKAADALKINDEEWPVVAELYALHGEMDGQVRALMDRFALRLVALTRGGAGSVLWTREEKNEHRGYPARIADTVGAGDAFSAVLARGLTEGWPVSVINDRANRLAAFICERHGATPPLTDEIRRQVVGAG